MTDKLYTPSKPVVFDKNKNTSNVQGSDTDQVNLQSREVSANADASTNKPFKGSGSSNSKEIQQILYGSTDPGVVAQYKRRKNKKRQLILEADSGGGTTQNLTFGRKHSGSVTLSNGDLTMVGSTGSWFYACPGATEDSDSSKLRADGGKWYYEVTIDSIPSTSAFCSIGFGNDNTSQFDTIVAGNGNGCALLVDDENGTLSRIYYGSSPNTFENASNPSFPLDAGGTVVTMGIDLDGATVSAYMDGVLVHSRAYALNGAEDDRIIPVVKSFWASQMTLNTTVQYPIDGYTVWK